MRLRIVRVQRLERLADVAVEPQPSRRRQLVVQRIPDEHVDEAEPPRRARGLGDDAAHDRLVEDVEEGVEIAFARPREGFQVELAPEHRREHKFAEARVGEVTQTAPDRVAHARRDRDPGVDARDFVQPAFGRKQLQDLADEERVAVGLAVDRRDQIGGRLETVLDLDQTGHVGLGQSAQRERRGRA